jgi:hypothetical protein
VIGDKTDEQRLAIVDVRSRKTRLLSPADLYVYEYDWSPDGKNLAAIAAHGSGDIARAVLPVNQPSFRRERKFSALSDSGTGSPRSNP